MKKCILLICLLTLTFLLNAQIPSYYHSIDFEQTGNELKVQLSQLITDTHMFFPPYTSESLDTWDLLQNSDLDPYNYENVLLIYGYNDMDGVFQTDRTRDKDENCTSNSCIGLWNREHVFARSLANPSLDTSFPGSGTDVHNLRAADSQMNSSRSNRLFEEGDGNATITAQGNFYPGDEWKGDVARIIMYMYLRYPSQCLANDIGFSANTYSPDMPDVFLEWNAQDPVSDFEVQRNDLIGNFQGNRNPFIDNSYLATQIWGGTPALDTWDILNVTATHSLNFTIYPNPVSTILYFKSTTVRHVKSIIYSLDGKKIKEVSGQSEIDVRNLVSGFYILKITQGNSTSFSKFLKN